MSFPYISEVNFEDGLATTGGGTFDSEVDTDSKLDIAHYSELARTPEIAMPYRGAFCMRVDLSGGTADAYLQEDLDWDMALDETQHWRFMLWVDPNITMANNDEFAIFKLQSTGPVDEAVIVINFTTANGLRIGVGETGGTNFLDLSTNRWHSVELSVTLDDGASDDGTLDLRLDGSAATQVASLDQAAIAQGRIGTMDIDAGTTRGVVLFDEILSDDARLFPAEIRFPTTILMTTSGHAFVGHGDIDNISLLSGAATDNVITVFDTDIANTDDAGNILTELKNTANNELVDPAGMPVHVRRGCYVNMSGTNPRALLNICKVQAYGSDGAIRNFGHKRKVPGGI